MEQIEYGNRPASSTSSTRAWGASIESALV
jgi:hypothetical protein